MRLRVVRALARKDLLVFFSDKRAVVMSFVVPIVLASFFAIVLGGANSGDSGERGKIAVAVADEDEGPTSKAIVKNAQADKNINVLIRDRAAAKEAVRKGEAVAALAIPKGFGRESARALFSPEDRPTVAFYHDPTKSAELGMVRGIFTQHVMQAVTSNAFIGAVGREMIKDALGQVEVAPDLGPIDRNTIKTMLQGISRWMERLDERRELGEVAGEDEVAIGGFRVPYETSEEPVIAGGKQAERAAAHAHSFGGMVVQFILFFALESGVALLTERGRGIWKRLRAAPVSRTEALAGRALSGSTTSLIIMFTVFSFGAAVFGIRVRGSFAGFLAICLCYALCASAFGLLVASLGKTPEATRGMSILAVLIMVMLGGAWIPSFLFPAWLQRITPAIPTRWAVDGFGATLARDYSFVECLPISGALVGFAAIFGLIAFWRFRWEPES